MSPILGRLLVAALWLCAGGYGVYVFFKHRNYVDSLPPDPDNDSLEAKA